MNLFSCQLINESVNKRRFFPTIWRALRVNLGHKRDRKSVNLRDHERSPERESRPAFQPLFPNINSARMRWGHFYSSNRKVIICTAKNYHLFYSPDELRPFRP